MTQTLPAAVPVVAPAPSPADGASIAPEPETSTPSEGRRTPLSAADLNWLRAGVLGANDGIVSVAAAVLGVVGATHELRPLLVAAVAVLVAGAMSMALGEYVSVSSARDAELVASRHAGDACSDVHRSNPVHAALASFLAFVAGGILPTLVVLGPWGARRDVATFAAVLLALVLTGWLSARVSGASAVPAIRRNVIGGSIAMAITYAIGTLVGAAL